jgi:hypothetical protein
MEKRKEVRDVDHHPEITGQRSLDRQPLPAPFHKG